MSDERPERRIFAATQYKISTCRILENKIRPKRIDVQGVDMGVLTECLVVLHLEEGVFYRKLKQRKRSVR